MQGLTLKISARKHENENVHLVESEIIKEKKIAIYLNDRKLLSVIALPTNSDAQVAGFLKSEGVITKKEDIKSININANNDEVRVIANINKENLKNIFHEKTLTSGCCVGISGNDGTIVEKFIDSKLKLKAKVVLEILNEFENSSELFHRTGCVHKAMIVYEGKNGICQLGAEDIGRHNAIDKVLGRAFLDGIDTQDCALFVSGRLSQEMIVKAAMHNVSIVISRAASTYLGIKTAQDLGITLVGFARNNSLLVYTHENRIF